jgi:ribokinase
VIYFDGNDVIELPAITSDNLQDTTGAGDTFNGNLAYCLTHNYNLKDAIIRSQYAASMQVQVPTAQAGMPYGEELNEYLLEQKDQ